MKINNKSSKFTDKVLLWQYDMNDLKSTNDQHLFHSIQDKFEKIFTIQSVLQAILNDNYQVGHTRATGRKFYIIDYKYLIEVK